MKTTLNKFYINVFIRPLFIKEFWTLISGFMQKFFLDLLH